MSKPIKEKNVDKSVFWIYFENYYNVQTIDEMIIIKKYIIIYLWKLHVSKLFRW